MAWIMTIARNLALMRLRRQQRAGDLTEEEWMALPDEGRGLSHEERMLLHSAVAALSEQERQIVLLYAVTGWKHRKSLRCCRCLCPRSCPNITAR